MFYNVSYKRRKEFLVSWDWNAIKTEYITDETSSYRKLAKKYGVSHNVIGARAVKEGWVELRQQHLDKTLTKTLSAISNGQARRAARVQTVADKLLDKIEEAVDNLDMKELFLDKQALRQVTAAMKDIKDILMIKSEADLREQDARIRNLEKQAEKTDESNDVTVVIGPEAEEYAE
jgi:isocitrate lyase